MFGIIFGWGHVYTKKLGEEQSSLCQNCNNYVIRDIIRVRKWASLFFIPCIPYSSKYYVICPICGASIEILKPNLSEEVV